MQGAPSVERVTDADDLTGSDEQILDELQKGPRTKGALVDATGLHRNTVGHRLEVLAASGIVREIHETTALYELVYDPRREWVQTLHPLVKEFVERCDLPNQHQAIAISFERGVEMLEATASSEDLRELKGALLFWAVAKYEDRQQLGFDDVELEARQLLKAFGYEDIKAPEDS